MRCGNFNAFTVSFSNHNIEHRAHNMEYFTAERSPSSLYDSTYEI